MGYLHEKYKEQDNIRRSKILHYVLNSENETLKTPLEYVFKSQAN